MSKLKGKNLARFRKNKSRIEAQNKKNYVRSVLASIRTFHDPILKEVCRPIVKAEAESLKKELCRVLVHTEDGVGLAAPQIGQAVQAFAYRENTTTGFISVMFNPEIIEYSPETEVRIEGCLSYPGVHAPVERSKKIKVKYLDENFIEQTKEFTDFIARIVAHESQHLMGICAIEGAWRQRDGKYD